MTTRSSTKSSGRRGNRRAVGDLRALFPDHRKRTYSDQQTERRAKLIEEVASAYRHRGLVLYVGAGVSRSMGLPTWPELIRILTVRMMTRKVQSAVDLLKGLSEEQRLQVFFRMTPEFEHQEMGDKPILMAARAIKDQLGAELARHVGSLLYRRVRAKYRMRLRMHQGKKQWSKEPIPPPASSLVDALVELARAERDARGVQAIINYNFDELLEENLRYQKVRATTVLSGSQLIPEGSLPCYHVHGLLSISDYREYHESNRAKNTLAAKGNFVFSEDEYHAEYSDPYKWSNMTQISHLGRYTGLFVGLSLQDPNLRRLIDVTHKQFPENYNFAILPRSEPLRALGDSKKAVLRNLFEEVETKSFERIGMRIIWVDDFDEIPEVVRSVISSPKVN